MEVKEMKRSALSAGVLAFLLFCAPLPSRAADSPWPMFRQNVQRTGLGIYPGLTAPTLEWSYSTGGAPNSAILV